jgi:hypothetical protein
MKFNAIDIYVYALCLCPVYVHICFTHEYDIFSPQRTILSPYFKIIFKKTFSNANKLCAGRQGRMAYPRFLI